MRCKRYLILEERGEKNMEIYEKNMENYAIKNIEIKF